jgi:GNAT superfamily N-acetyltransferase
MVRVEPPSELHLDQLSQLVNCHLAGVVPGWRMPAGVIASSVQELPGPRGIDPWVVERRTLCAVDGDRLLGAAHLLRYGADESVSACYRGAAEVAWLLFWPRAPEAAEALIVAARELAAEWAAGRLCACDTSLPVPVVSGVPETWPHVADALTQAGFEPVPDAEEVLYGGALPEPSTGPRPLTGLRVLAATDEPGHCFRADVDGVEVGHLEWAPDLSYGGALPALAGWAELCSLRVGEEWRGRGVGSWLVGRTVPLLQAAGATQVVIALTALDEALGAGRFCRRLGWDPLVRLEHGWAVPAPPARPVEEH